MAGTASDFPSPYPVLIKDRSYGINTSFEPYRRQSFRHTTIPSQREAVDLTNEPGEGTINVEGLWRRGQYSWHKGAGQLYVDRKDSDPHRFLSSFGVDISNQDQLTLLPATVARVSDGTSTYDWATVAVAGSYVYHLQGLANPGGACRVRYTTDYASWTTPTGLPSTDMYVLATDGNLVLASGDGGVYGTVAGSSTWTQIITDTVDHIWYAAGRWIAGVDNGTNPGQLWDITSQVGAFTAGALAADGRTAFATGPTNTWQWLDVTAGESYLYFAGVSGNPGSTQVGYSAIYQTSVISAEYPDLQAPDLALALEKGEFAGSLYAYQNFIFIGSNLGIRTCRTVSQWDPQGNAGDLISGPLIPGMLSPIQAPFQPYIGNWVSGIVGYNRWVWFSWPQYVDNGTTYWALGRLDLGNIVAELQPAYATDLAVASIATSQNSHHTLDWDPVTNGPLMIVPGRSDGTTGWNGGLYTQDYNVTISGATKYVHTGHLVSGRITYGIPDMKQLAQANLKTAPANLYAPYDTAAGTITLSVAYDGGSFASLAPLAPNTQANPPVLITPITPAEEIMVEAILTAGAVSYTDDTRPFLSRWTGKALPCVVSGATISPVIMLYVSNDLEGYIDFNDPYGEYAYLENLRLSQTIFTYKEASSLGGATQFVAQCVITEIDWLPYKLRDNADEGFEGDCIVYLKSLVG